MKRSVDAQVEEESVLKAICIMIRTVDIGMIGITEHMKQYRDCVCDHFCSCFERTDSNVSDFSKDLQLSQTYKCPE